MEVRKIIIPYSPRAQFLPLHNRKQRFAAVVAHRRAGKTVAEVNEKIRSALTCKLPNPRTAYIAPFLKQAKTVAWTYAKEYGLCVPGAIANESELKIDFPNGGQFRLYGADNLDALRGIYLDDVTLDEYADMNPRLFPEIIRPTLVDRLGRATFIGTPKGQNDFYKICEFAKKDPDWFFLRLRASETAIVPRHELESLRREMTEEQYMQEFECSFDAAILGAYYGKEMYQAHEDGRLTRVKHDPEWKVHTAWDLGWSDDTAIWFYQVIGGEVRVLEYFFANGQNIDYYADYILSKKEYDYGTHWLPHDAKAKTLASGGRSIQEQLTSKLGGWCQVRIVPNLSVQDGIQAVRKMLPRTWFDEENCKEGIEALRQYQREYDDERKCFKEQPKHDWTSHPADAFRMLAIVYQEEVKTTTQRIKEDNKIYVEDQINWMHQQLAKQEYDRRRDNY
jgi:phage terminase large subunit